MKQKRKIIDWSSEPEPTLFDGGDSDTFYQNYSAAINGASGRAQLLNLRKLLFYTEIQRRIHGNPIDLEHFQKLTEMLDKRIQETRRAKNEA